MTTKQLLHAYIAKSQLAEAYYILMEIGGFEDECSRLHEYLKANARAMVVGQKYGPNFMGINELVGDILQKIKTELV